MAFVLDASVAAVWALADESSLLADIAADRLKNEKCSGAAVMVVRGSQPICHQ